MKLPFALLILAILPAGAATPKPLQVYILAGQSNMQGHAKVSTFEHIGNPEQGDTEPFTCYDDAGGFVRDCLPTEGTAHTIDFLKFGRDGALTKVDLLTHRIAGRVMQAGNSIGGAISADGRLVVAQNYTPGGIKAFDTATLELVADTVLLPTSCTQVFCMPWALAVVTTSLSLMMPLLSPANALAS